MTSNRVSEKNEQFNFRTAHANRQQHRNVYLPCPWTFGGKDVRGVERLLQLVSHLPETVDAAERSLPLVAVTMKMANLFVSNPDLICSIRA